MALFFSRIAHHAGPGRTGPGPGVRVWFTLAILPLLALGLDVALAASHELGFSRSVTPGLIQRYGAEFGRGSKARIGSWQAFIRTSAVLAQAGNGTERPMLTAAGAPPRQLRAGSELELLGSVNTFFNGVPYDSDLSHWGADDYWATPAEMLASDGADCEDFSIAKYFALKELGVPIERLRITYVKALRLNQAHMVLAYYPAPDAVPLILDSLEASVRPATERTDLVPVYSFNDEDLLIARQNQPSARAGSPLQIRLWRGLLDKLEKELSY